MESASVIEIITKVRSCGDNPKQTDRQMGKQTDGWMDGQMDNQCLTV